MTPPCDACREHPAPLDRLGQRLCPVDKHCPVLDARCPWPGDCDRCQQED